MHLDFHKKWYKDVIGAVPYGTKAQKYIFHP